jgi:hypothetical protein
VACRPQGPPRPLAVEVAGCADILRPGPVCLLRAEPKEPDTKLTLWLPSSVTRSRPEVRLDGRSIEAPSVPAGEGERIVIRVPVKEGRLEVRREGVPGPESWALSLAPRPPEPEWFDRAYRLATSDEPGDEERARDLLLAQLPGAAPFWRASALSVLARPSESSPGSPSPSGRLPRELLLERAVAAHRAAGRTYGAAFDAVPLARLRRQRFDFAGAERTLTELGLAPAAAPAEALVLIDLERSLLARDAGDTRGALQLLRAVEGRARRLNLAVGRGTAEQVRALLFLDLGRFEEAEPIFARLEVDMERAEADPCERQDWAANRGWGRLLARAAGRDVGDPLPFLLAARAQAADGRCAEAHRRLNASLNLALAHLQRGEIGAATAELGAARRLAHVATGEEQLWLGELEARREAALGHAAEADRLYRALARAARSHGASETLWWADIGQARALAASGPTARERALALLREAEDLIDRRSSFVPWPGRARFAAQREAGSRLRIELLLAAGRPEEALRAARRSRARVPRQLETETRIERLRGEERQLFLALAARYREERRRCDQEGAEAWRASLARQAEEGAARAARCDAAESDLEREIGRLGAPGAGQGPRDPEAFRPPAPGEVVLAYHPLDQGWVGFAADASGVEAHRFALPSPLPDSAALSGVLLAPFAGRLRAARRVRVLPYGALAAVDFHALPFAGEPLILRRAVVYALDLAAGAPLQPRSSRGRKALVVADPGGDLPSSGAEAVAVEERLQAGGWRVLRLTRDKASVDGMLAGMRSSDLLHFAGHARPGSAEEGGELVLAASGRLSAAEILALERVPPWVVLAGCDSAVSDREAPAEGLGLAHAFLVRGARQVIAALRPVPDGETARLFAALYTGAGEPDLARLLQGLQALALDPHASAAARAAALSFRVYEP